jgi:murein DD-endopeptidase MepM/ murein hydrolase activator NlpD
VARVIVPAAGGVELRPLSGNRLQPVDARGGLDQAGQALERFGQFGVAYAEEQDRIDATLDNAAVRERDNADSEWLRDRLWTGDNAFFKLRGFDALNAREGLEKELQDRRQQALEGLTNPRQRELYQRVSSARFGQEQEGIARYAVQQAQAEEDRQSVSRITAASNDAMTYWRDPVRLEEFIQIAELETMGLADRQGWAPERAAEARTEVRSNILARIVRQGVDDDPVSAARFLNENRAAILPSEEFALDNELRQPLMERQVTEYADAWEQGRAPRNVLIDTQPPPAPPVVPPTLSLADQARPRDAEGTAGALRLAVVPTAEGAAVVNLTRPDGTPMTEAEAAAEFRRSGQHLGIYADEDTALAVVDRVEQTEAERFLAPPPPAQVATVPPEAAGFVMPVAGSFNQSGQQFGASRDGGSRRHNGLDIAAREGSDVSPIAAGQVIAVGSDPKSGRYVRVRHADGSTSSYAHLGRVDVAVGQEVRPGQSVGGVGRTGNATGSVLHLVIRDRNGRAVDPRPLLEGASPPGSVAATGGADGTPPVRDLGQAYAWVDSLGLPHDMRQALRREVATRISTQKAIVDQRQAAAADQAYEVYAQNPDGFTNTSVIPRQVWASMDARTRAQFEGLASAARDRIEAKKAATTNWEAYARFSDLAGTDPARFLQVPMAELRANLSDGDFEQMLTLRRSIQSAGRGSSTEQVTHSRINGITNPLLLAAGIARPPERERNRGSGAEADQEYWRTVGQFRQAVSDGVRRWQANNPGKEITDDDIRDIANSQLVRAWRSDDREGTERWLFQVPAGSRGPGWTYRMPAGTRARIVEQYRRRWRREPTEAEIDQIWRYGPTR